ncbi:hypothetical protein PSPO01_09872 [Paraphaeosphaeria sporulosa]
MHTVTTSMQPYSCSLTALHPQDPQPLKSTRDPIDSVAEYRMAWHGMDGLHAAATCFQGRSRRAFEITAAGFWWRLPSGKRLAGWVFMRCPLRLRVCLVPMYAVEAAVADAADLGVAWSAKCRGMSGMEDGR